MRNEICDNPIKNYICDNLWMKIERLKMVIDDKKPHPRFAAKMGSKKTQINDIHKTINMLNKSVISLSYRRIPLTAGRRGTP